MKANLTINLDEISSDIDKSISFFKEMDLHTCELRLINRKNLCLMRKNEVVNFANKLKKEGIIPVSIASPIFKWNTRNSTKTIVHDNFGINANLSSTDKLKIINNILEYADILSVNKIRFFSHLGKTENPVNNLVRDKLFKKIIGNNHTFLLENEPVCTICTKRQLEEFVDYNINNDITNVKIWLDIANLIQIGENIDSPFIEKIAPYISYIHIKDFIYVGNYVKYVPVGTGIIDYNKILSLLNKYIPDSQDIIISIETHAKTEDEKYTFSKQSVIELRKKLKEVQI